MIRSFLHIPPPPDDDDNDKKQRAQFERFEREAMAMSEEFRARAALLMREEQTDAT